MSDNLKFFKGNESALPAANQERAGNIYHCDDTHNTYLDDGAVLQPFASAVGRTYIDEESIGGEIFGDYENNVATGQHSEAHGTGTTVSSDNQAAFGKYNANDANNIFEIGIGTSADDTKNGMSLSATGSLTVYENVQNSAYAVMPLSIWLRINGSSGAIEGNSVYDVGLHTASTLQNTATTFYYKLINFFNQSTAIFKRPIDITVVLTTMSSTEPAEIEYNYCSTLSKSGFRLRLIDHENSQIVHIWLCPGQKNCLIETFPFATQSVLSGTTEPTADIGEDGDLYIMPYNTRIPAIYSGTTIPTSAIGVDGDIYVLYEA